MAQDTTPGMQRGPEIALAQPASKAATTSAANTFLGRATLPVTLLVQAAASAAILAPTVAAPRLLENLQAAPVAIGIYIAAVYLAAMVSSQLGASLVRRWGPIRTSQWALVLCAAGLMLLGIPHWGAALAGAVLLGFGYGPITPASSEMLARTTPPERYALVFSVKQTGVPLGGALAGLLVPALLHATSAYWSMAAMAVPCLLGLVLAQPLRETLDAARDPHAPLPSFTRVAQPVAMVLRHPALRRIAFCTLIFSCVQLSFTSYVVSFLTGELHWTLVAAGVASSIAQGAGVIGRVLWGWLADRAGGAMRMLIGLAVLMMIASLAMLMLSPQTANGWVWALLVLYGASAIGWNGVFLGSVARLVPHHQAAAATAGSLFFTYFGVVIGPPLFGLIGGMAGSLGVAFALLAIPVALACVMLSWPEANDRK